VTRRTLLVRGAQTAAVVTLGGGAVAACGGGYKSPSTGSPRHGLAALPGGRPRRGGTFTVAAISGGSAETLFPGAAATTADVSRTYALFEPLFYPGRNISPLTPGLAVSAESNPTATKWTFHLREGVTWHDGKPLTAADLVYNFRTVWADHSNAVYGVLGGLTDFQSARAVGPLAVEVSLLQPVAEFPTIFAYSGTLLLPEGATMKSTQNNPIGTGPFKFVSFTPGARSVFAANRNYWQTGKPYVDELVVDSSFTDQVSAFDALVSGKVNLYPGVPLTIARQQLSSKQVQILESPPSAQVFGFCMRVDKGPFSDNRIRTGFKLLADRQAMIDGALAGFGVPGHDIPGYGCRYYADNLKRTQDVEQAKSLFKAAGVAGQTFTLTTSATVAGQVESATLLAQQAAAAGITVKVQTQSAETYFTATGGYTSRYFGQEINQTTASLTAVYRAELITGASYNDTHWGDGPQGAARTAAIEAAISATDPAEAQRRWNTVQEAQFNQGGYLWWANLPFVDAAANDVRGLSAGAGFNFNSWQLQDGWLA
jgi:peptide/nickel transport system substrate-binding protein